MLQFALKLIKAAASDTLHSMGTRALAVGAGLTVAAVLLSYDLMHGVKTSWTGGAAWGIGTTLAIWLGIFGYFLCRHFRPVLREHRRVFRLLAFNQDQTTDADRISIWCLLQFCKDLGSVELVVRVTTLLPVGAPITNVVHSEKLEGVSRGEKKRLALGSLRVARPQRPAYQSIWGSEVGTESLKPGQTTILTDTGHLIEISAGPQTYRCYVQFVAPPPGALSAAMYLTDEDRSPWILDLQEAT